MSASAPAAPPERRAVLALLGALSLVLVLADVHGLVTSEGAGALRALGFPGWLHPGILGAELLGVILLWPRRTMMAGGWLLAALIAVAGVIHVAAGRLPLEYVLYLAVLYALARLRRPGARLAEAAPELHQSAGGAYPSAPEPRLEARKSMKAVVALTVNGDRREVAVPEHWTLLETLRYALGLTGSKQGCDKGDCGACTVLLDGEPVLACITPVWEAEGRDVITVEGLAEPGRLNELQAAFAQTGGAQCGFCTPGVLMSAWGLLLRNPAPTREDIREALAGNLCRCTGYTKIYEAVELAAQRLSGSGGVGECGGNPAARSDSPTPTLPHAHTELAGGAG